MNDAQFLYSLITAVFVGAGAGYLGSLMVTKRMALVGDALGHVALPGVALALLYNFNIAIGAIASLFVGIFLIWFFKTKTELYMEALTGIIFAVSLAVAFLVIPHEDLELALIGDITKVSSIETIISIVLVIFAFIATRKIFPNMILSTMSEDLAYSRKINVKLYDLAYLLTIGVVIALGIKIVGSLLIGALVVIPASASRNITYNLRQYSYGAMIIGALSCVAGIFAFKSIGFGAGPLIILSGAAIFLFTLALKKK